MRNDLSKCIDGAELNLNFKSSEIDSDISGLGLNPTTTTYEQCHLGQVTLSPSIFSSLQNVDDNSSTMWQSGGVNGIL